jgi:hypothetical protein
MSIDETKQQLADIVRSSLIDSGVIAGLKQVAYNDPLPSDNDSMDDLKQEAQTAVADIQRALDARNPDDTGSQKLKSALVNLRSALAKGTISRAALEMALAEAASAMSGTEGATQSTSQKIEEQLWLRVESDNKDIDDDFTKMRKAGVIFNDSLWNKHQQLMEYLQTYPHDISKQKELDAVDDVMLMQAGQQLDKCSDAKPSFDDAQKKSEDRHNAVDKALAGIAKKKSVGSDISMADFDDVRAPDSKLTLNDVKSQAVGQKPTSSVKQGI